MIFTVPVLEKEPWPTLGPQICEFIESNLVFGPGDLRGEPARLDAEKRALIYRMYEIYPKGHPQEGRRRFKRVCLSLRKGSAKTELGAWIAAAELHHEGPVRCVGWDKKGNPIGGPVTDPYIPMVACTEEQTEELGYGALKTILEESPIARDFDIGMERIVRRQGDGKAVGLTSAPNARDGARTTMQFFDEPLALDTPVPTPLGWTTIGKIAEGDEVYGRHGEPVRVIGLSPIHHGRQCYRVTFAGGDSVVTDAGHRWTVINWSNRLQGEHVRTTEEMFEIGINTAYGKRWRLPRANGFDGQEQQLPIHPYVLGLWLGDGSSQNATITVGDADLIETEKRIADYGYVVTRCASRGRAQALYVTVPNSNLGRNGHSLVGDLRKLGLLGNKHIPALYLDASREQRLALFQGLMDADGHVTSRGTCTFVQGKRQIAETVRFLAHSLGIPATLVSTDDERSRTGHTYKVHFTPHVNVFQLKRKAACCRSGAKVGWAWPTIVDISPCESVPVKCLAVDSWDHLFLVGHGLHLTHNTHRFVQPKLRKVHQTMMANIPKRRQADAWSLETTTAFAPGEGSIAESTWEYAKAVAEGLVSDPRLFFFHRQAADTVDISTPEGLRAAILEASGPVAEWSDIESILEQFNDPTSDRSYLERMWLNRLVRASDRAFDAMRWAELSKPHVVPDGELITLGFDGARFEDATGIIATHIETGYQWVLGVWEHPYGIKEWEVPSHEVENVIAEAFQRWEVWRMYADPPYWETHVAKWAGEYGEKRIIEWRTNRTTQTAYAIKAFNNAIQSGELSHDGNPRYAAHVGNSYRRMLNLKDDQGQPLFVIYKERSDSPQKIDLAMAGILSWEARNDALSAGVSGRSVYEDRGILVL